LGVSRKADGPCCVKKIIVAKPKEVKTGWTNIGYVSKRAVLPMMMIIINILNNAVTLFSVLCK
jgi:hypothetical protein